MKCDRCNSVPCRCVYEPIGESNYSRVVPPRPISDEDIERIAQRVAELLSAAQAGKDKP